MKKYILIASILASMAHARTSPSNTMVDNRQDDSFHLADGQAPADGLYYFADGMILTTKAEYFDGKLHIDQEAQTLSFSKGEPVSVFNMSNGDIRIGLVLGDDERATIPNAIVIDKDDFAKSGLIHIGPGGYKDLLAQFSNIAPFKEARRGGIRVGPGRLHFRGVAGGMYYGCLGYVCRALGICAGPIGGGRGMTSYLRARGWQTTSCASPQAGDVASWSGGSHGSGHTAIWQGGWCYDQGCQLPGSGFYGMNCVRR